jgi:hypothetical protein
VCLLFTENPRRLILGKRASDNFHSRKLGFWHTKFSATELPEMPVLGNSEGIRRTEAVRSNALLGGTLRTR